MKIFLNKNIAIFSLIFVVFLLKLTLVNKGFLAFPDENRYSASIQIVEHISQFDFHKALETVYATQGRPGEALIKIIPSVFQYVYASLLGYEYYETRSALPLFIFNTIVFCLLLLVHYRFSLIFLKDKFLSLFSVLVFSCLVVSYISLRHADPYDFSLLLLYHVFYRIVEKLDKNQLNLRTIFWYGFLAFFGYTCYPGYILLFMAIPIVFFLNNLNKQSLGIKLKQLAIFSLGSSLCLAIYELFARIVGKSYIYDSLVLSKTITQGSFEECFSFLFKYLYEAEGFNGRVLIIGLGIYIIILVYQITTTKQFSRLHIIFLTLFILFIAYASLGFYLHKVVFYARLIKQFFPFLILFFVVGFHYLFKIFKLSERATIFIFFSLAVLFFINFCSIVTEYKSYYYPKDIIWAFHNKNIEISEVFECNYKIPQMPKFKNKETNSIINSKKYVFVNSFCYPFNNVKEYVVYKNNRLKKVVFSELSCLNFKAYQFEGYTSQARINLDKTKLRIKIYELK